ncbi:F-box only protein 38-like isoform X2 [Mytilus californianus]|uniref:F-box only protein 38-like isoform X1 n=1 Tax=Mytilus californianus TaxID=6549 RepID=UPI002245D60C|nr:F-box only protein 38-like isoform X1 [Mytilus californianus]XP_052092628.1 F-box only protein 38-like isoform X2 [Mytilus californianus]
MKPRKKQRIRKKDKIKDTIDVPTEKEKDIENDEVNKSGITSKIVEKQISSQPNENIKHADQDYVSTLSLEVLCNIMRYLHLRDFLKLDHLSRKLHNAVTMHLRVKKNLDFSEGELISWMSDRLSDSSLLHLFKRCLDLQYIYGFHPPYLSKRRQRGTKKLSIPGIIESLSVLTQLKGVEVSDTLVLGTLFTYFAHVEVLGTFRNRDGCFPIDDFNVLRIPENPMITSMHLIGIVIPKLPALIHLKHLQLRYVHFINPQPFKDFAVPSLKSFVMANCAGPTNVLKYVPLIAGLAAARSLQRMELIRVPFLGGLLHHVIHDGGASLRGHRFKNMQTMKFGACKHVIGMDIGFLAIASAESLEEMYLQPSLTKDSLFIALKTAFVQFPVFDRLYLGYTEPFQESGNWTNQDLVIEGLDSVTESPSTITDVGMKAVGECFPTLRYLELYNSPHIHKPTDWFSPDANAWDCLRELVLRRCHSIKLEEFCAFIPSLPVIEAIHLELMFREPPKGCSRVGLSAGTGFGLSSSLIPDAPVVQNNQVPNQNEVNNNLNNIAANQNANNNMNNVAANQNADNIALENAADDHDEVNIVVVNGHLVNNLNAIEPNVEDGNDDADVAANQNIPINIDLAKQKDNDAASNQNIADNGNLANQQQGLCDVDDAKNIEMIDMEADSKTNDSSSNNENSKEMSETATSNESLFHTETENNVGPAISAELNDDKNSLKDKSASSSTYISEYSISLPTSRHKCQSESHRCGTQNYKDQASNGGKCVNRDNLPSFSKSSIKVSSDENVINSNSVDTMSSPEVKPVEGKGVCDRNPSSCVTGHPYRCKKCDSDWLSKKETSVITTECVLCQGNSAESYDKMENSRVSQTQTCKISNESAETDNVSNNSLCVTDKSQCEVKDDHDLYEKDTHDLNKNDSIHQGKSVLESDILTEEGQSHEINEQFGQEVVDQVKSENKTESCAANSECSTSGVATRNGKSLYGKKKGLVRKTKSQTSVAEGCMESVENLDKDSVVLNNASTSNCDNETSKSETKSSGNQKSINYIKNVQKPRKRDNDKREVFILENKNEENGKESSDKKYEVFMNPAYTKSDNSSVVNDNDSEEQQYSCPMTRSKSRQKQEDDQNEVGLEDRKRKSVSNFDTPSNFKKKCVARKVITLKIMFDRWCQVNVSDLRQTAGTASKDGQNSCGTSGYIKIVQKSKKSPVMCDKMTSTSDPVMEDDRVQVLTLKSRSLQCMTLNMVGITDLILEDCPKLSKLSGHASRVLKSMTVKKAPVLNRIDFTQCKKLDENGMVKQIGDLQSRKSRLIFLRPMHQFDARTLERDLFSKKDIDYSICIIYDHSPEPLETMYNRVRVQTWQDLIAGMNLELLKNYGYKEWVHQETEDRENYPWGRSIYTMSGYNSNSSRWELLTDIPWLRPLYESPDLNLGQNNKHPDDARAGVYCPSAKGHDTVKDCIYDCLPSIVDGLTMEMPLHIHSLIVYVNLCDIHGTPTYDPYA